VVKISVFSSSSLSFGKGSIEGIAGAEAANNAATGGAMVPAMVLGIPGSGTTAVILVGLMVHGLRPGPYLFTEQVDKVYQIFGAMLLANLMFMAMGLYAAKLFARISLVPLQILWPIVFALAVIGAYALSSSLLDVWIVLIFGVVGFLARRHGFAVAPIAVSLILGEMVETNFQNSLKMFDGQWWMILTQPLAAMFLVFAFMGLFGPAILSKISKKST
jgi:putative tricarboxylic transport membrane protein